MIYSPKERYFSMSYNMSRHYLNAFDTLLKMYCHYINCNNLGQVYSIFNMVLLKFTSNPSDNFSTVTDLSKKETKKKIEWTMSMLFIMYGNRENPKK